MAQTTLVKMKFGSTVYGTSVPTSDIDLKAVYLPGAEEILLQHVKDSITLTTKKDKNAKNEAGDIDMESFSLHKYLRLLLEGQTVALDMLFVPTDMYEMEPHPIWKLLQKNRHRFLHSGAASFAGYCKTQANKYGIKGSRVAAVRATVDFIAALSTNHPEGLHGRMRDVWDQVEAFVVGKEHIFITMCKGPDGQEVPHLECCDRLTAIHNSFKQCLDVYTKILDNYGKRARQAESNQGVDWKALGHAVRVCEEAKELLSTGKVTFPRPERLLLLQIRKGELPYKDVAALIEKGLVELEGYSEKSLLPKKPDFDFADALVAKAYADVVIAQHYESIWTKIWKRIKDAWRKSEKGFEYE